MYIVKKKYDEDLVVQFPENFPRSAMCFKSLKSFFGDFFGPSFSFLKLRDEMRFALQKRSDGMYVVAYIDRTPPGCPLLDYKEYFGQIHVLGGFDFYPFQVHLFFCVYFTHYRSSLYGTWPRSTEGDRGSYSQLVQCVSQVLVQSLISSCEERDCFSQLEHLYPYYYQWVLASDHVASDFLIPTF